MQLNIYVPDHRRSVLDALERTARATGRPKNELVLEALEGFLAGLQVPLPLHHLGQTAALARAELYRERTDR